jgi:hypothetical protein
VGFFGQDSELELSGLETSALPSHSVDAGLLELVSEQTIELKTLARRQCFETSAFLTATED